MLLLLSSCALLDRQAAAPLEFESLVPDGDGPPAVGSTTMRWTAAASGGAGELSYEFRTLKGSEEVVEQQGPSPTWDWSPERSRKLPCEGDGRGQRWRSGGERLVVCVCHHPTQSARAL